jgi:hypothetical protein
MQPSLVCQINIDFKGLRIMSFGVIYDFPDNGNHTKVIKGADLIKEQWFIDAITQKDRPIDMFLVIGHNPVRASGKEHTFGLVYKAIRDLKPDTPITFFGGHTHIRDFHVWDNKAVGLEPGRYCETVGWLSIDGISNYKAVAPSIKPTGPAIPLLNGTESDVQMSTLNLTKSPSSLRYSRRYLDWNRRTFEYHANGSQAVRFDTQTGKAITAVINGVRREMNLSVPYGQVYIICIQSLTIHRCANQSYCQYCSPIGSGNNIFTKLIPEVLATVVVNEARNSDPRLVFLSTGAIRYDLLKGPVTAEDAITIIPRKDRFNYIPDVPYEQAVGILKLLNDGKPIKAAKNSKENDSTTLRSGPKPNSRIVSEDDETFRAADESEKNLHKHSEIFARNLQDADVTIDSQTVSNLVERMDQMQQPELCGPPSPNQNARDHMHIRRRGTTPLDKESPLSTGYMTTDDFGTDGDDTPHSSKREYVAQPDVVQARAGPWPKSGESITGVKVDIVFQRFLQRDIIQALNSMLDQKPKDEPQEKHVENKDNIIQTGWQNSTFTTTAVMQGREKTYTADDVKLYLPDTFTTRDMLPIYVKKNWAGGSQCPIL